MLSRLVTALSLVILAATACGGGTSGNSPQPVGTPKAGGTLTFGLRADISASSLDPIKIFSDSDYSVATAIYDRLIDRVGEKGDLGPMLADSWQMSDDLKSCTLKLHPGITFHDGTPFNGDAVVFNIKRQQDPTSVSRADSLQIVDVSATDATTVVFKLASPWIDFPQVLAAQVGMIASPTAIRTLGAPAHAKAPVGTGPFVFKEWVTGDHITATKNAKYWKPGRPYLDSVTYRPIPDQDTKYAALKSGQIDVLQLPSADQVLQARKDSKLKVQSYKGNGGTFIMLHYNAPPFNDPHARLAVSYATDRAAIVKEINRDTQVVARGPFPTDSEWYKDVGDPNFDLTKAKAEVTAYGKPLKFKFNIVSDPLTRQYGQVLQQQWKNAGMEVELVQADQVAHIGFALTHKFEAEIFQYGDWFDPDRNFFIQLRSGSPVNYTEYSNPATDAALVKGRTTTDVSARKLAYTTFQTNIAKDQPYVWMHYNTTYFITNQRAQNLNTPYSAISKPLDMWASK
jgi:peptide/nickel transport system substrate-binding protein